MLWSALPVLLEVVPAAVGLAVGIQAASQPAYIAGFTFTGVYWLVLSFVVVGLVTVFIPPLRRASLFSWVSAMLLTGGYCLAIPGAVVTGIIRGTIK